MPAVGGYREQCHGYSRPQDGPLAPQVQAVPYLRCVRTPGDAGQRGCGLQRAELAFGRAEPGPQLFGPGGELLAVDHTASMQAGLLVQQLPQCRYLPPQVRGGLVPAVRRDEKVGRVGLSEPVCDIDFDVLVARDV